jgi:hypothetical protein
MVTIKGDGSHSFSDPSTVTFGGVAATSVSVIDDNTIQCDAPIHSAGVVNVVVANVDGTTGTITNGFAFIPPGGHGLIRNPGMTGGING